MLQLFQSIFGKGEEHGRYPESLIEAATERVVESTDPRLRALPGYRRLLRVPLVHAIDHISSLIDSIPPPVAADRAHYSGDSPLTTLFASAEHMQDVFVKDAALGAFRDTAAGLDGQVTALLLVRREEKRVMGIDMVGEILRRDVPQVVVKFSHPRLVDPAAAEEETRRQLKRRAFDYLLGLALSRISEVRQERTDLDRQRALLQRKLRAVKYGGWDFDDSQEPEPDHAVLQAELDSVEKELAALGANENLLRAHLDLASEVLTNAEQYLWAEGVELRLDRMNIQQDAQNQSARDVSLRELHDARDRRMVMLLISIPVDDLPRREDFLTAAKRYLG